VITVRLRNGLGNQMFQYAAARRLAERHGTDVVIDVSWYANKRPGMAPRSYELDQLSVTGRVSQRRVRWIRNTPLPTGPIDAYRTLRPRARAARERHFRFDPAVRSLPDNVTLSGYWTSEKYFADIAPIIRAEFAVRSEPSAANKAWIDTMSSCTSVAVHMRRRDYLHPRTRQGVADLEYYDGAVGHLRARCADPVFFVFSDDLEWARANVRLCGDTCFVDTNQGAAGSEDLRLMSSCRHAVIANSTYSWWGAWLNPDPERIVIAPRRWMVDPRVDTRDVLPSEWVAL
jgi:hypothetical protein